MTAGGADAGDPPATVVVPTRDRPHALARCLAALRDQVCIALEVVVVDDGSRDPQAVERALESLPDARLVRPDGRGPAAARNAGVPRGAASS